MTERPDVEIHIPPKPEYVALVRHVIGATARMGGLSPDAVRDREQRRAALFAHDKTVLVLFADATRVGPRSGATRQDQSPFPVQPFPAT